MDAQQRPQRIGRGAQINPPNRFDKVHAEPDLEYLEYDPDAVAELERPKTEYLPDTSKSIVTENDSPDIPFRFSLNPYRGCSHGCSYCYARPTHEYLGLSAGLDFETKVFVKHDAPRLFRDFLARPGWTPETIVLSGVTDCYQPAEREFQLTRKCLQVALEARQAVEVITKNALVIRDLDLLQELAALRLVRVNFSITTLNATLARTMEPRTSTPAARLRAMRTLANAGVTTRVMVAPVVPGLTDSEIPAILAAAAEAGAQGASYVLLRLPLAVAPIFRDWLERTHPTHRDRIEALIRATRDGKLNSSEWGTRMRGTGPLADQIQQTFRVFVRKSGLDRDLPPLDTTQFRPPSSKSGQQTLF